MDNQFVIGVEIYQKPNGRFEVHTINQVGHFEDKRVKKIIKNDDADEGYDDFEFYANALCIAVAELVND